MRGTVNIAVTGELLVDGAASSGAVLIMEEALSLVEVAMQIEQIPVDPHNSDLIRFMAYLGPTVGRS
ncbi:hypothetical protein BS47DRAFT_1345061 [Hydnum rufescens UP504]|uniref:Uncharacterized protein n=1 Tax=Hydnum rufescens UP504 TaxID=1448309 RepID=A0A9P6DT31_9AGAM|nr:hypothetical protein BS47DRAFT_1345061 [Hydnum rufescens UP504]